MSNVHTRRWLRSVSQLAVFLMVFMVAAACGGGAGDDAAPLELSPASLPGGVTGTSYAQTLSASGGAGGYTWSLIAGALPPGLAGLPASGSTATLSGVLGAPGTYGFTVRLTDSDGAVVERLFNVTISTGGGGGPGNDHTTTLVNAPAARFGHTAVWTGTEMIIWGGGQQLGLLGDGGAYDPAVDTWRTLSAVGAPAARSGHTAAWTGTEMIVWGGWGPNGPFGDGAAYDPVQDTWRPLPAAAAPQARAGHTAVWSGTAMLVFGGQGVFPPPAPNSVDLVFADGAAYNPTTNAWTPLAAAPTAARAHTAVWTGTRMVTWGGRDSFALTINAINTGGILDPVGNAWQATNVANAPAARIDHTAVWTGLSMIVWGGSGGIAPPMATGGRLNPVSNTWAATTTVGAPSARSIHTAVWTGTEMVVWGGWGTTSPLADGRAYNPLTNTWRAVNPGITPVPRARHTAVWTGTSMIIWGGLSTPTDTYLSSGAVLHP